jgi:hypothetical protein
MGASSRYEPVVILFFPLLDGFSDGVAPPAMVE